MTADMRRRLARLEAVATLATADPLVLPIGPEPVTIYLPDNGRGDALPPLPADAGDDRMGRVVILPAAELEKLPPDA